MSRKIQYLVLHTSAGWQKQSDGQWTQGGHLMDFFLGPKKLPTGNYLYKGKTYQNQAALPDEKLPFSRISVRQAYPFGNGWITGGYHKLVEGDGHIYHAYEDETPTNGVRPSPDGQISNSNSLHLTWIGGLEKHGGRLVAVDNRTKAQKEVLTDLVLAYLHRYPNLLILGHYQANQKVCPLFNVPMFLKAIGVAAGNIYLPDPWGIGKTLK